MSGVLSDLEIRNLVRTDGMIEPFEPAQVRYRITDGGDPVQTKIISYGLSSYGYDARVVDRYLIYHNAFSTYIDPKRFDEKSFVEVKGQGYVFIPPNSFTLTETVEYIKVPRDCIVWVAAKSTYARVGMVVNATILEPEWEGTVTLELSNTTPLPIKVYSNEGIVQLIFQRASGVCETSYADKGGKYQRQRGITLPRL